MAYWTGRRKLAKAKNMWSMVNGPATATIATLIDLAWKPVTPQAWFDPNGKLHNFVEDDGISHYEVLHVIKSHLESKLWKHVAQAWSGEGLESGTPSFVPATKTYDRLIRQGNDVQARALEHLCVRLFSGNVTTTEFPVCDTCTCHGNNVNASVVRKKAANDMI